MNALLKMQFGSASEKKNANAVLIEALSSNGFAPSLGSMLVRIFSSILSESAQAQLGPTGQTAQFEAQIESQEFSEPQRVQD